MSSEVKSWSAADDAELLTCIGQGRSLHETARQLGRSSGEVRARLDELSRETGPLPRDVAAS